MNFFTSTLRCLRGGKKRNWSLEILFLLTVLPHKLIQGVLGLVSSKAVPIFYLVFWPVALEVEQVIDQSGGIVVRSLAALVSMGKKPNPKFLSDGFIGGRM